MLTCYNLYAYLARSPLRVLALAPPTSVPLTPAATLCCSICCCFFKASFSARSNATSCSSSLTLQFLKIIIQFELASQTKYRVSSLAAVNLRVLRSLSKAADCFSISSSIRNDFLLSSSRPSAIVSERCFSSANICAKSSDRLPKSINYI